MEAAFEDPVFVAARDFYVATLSVFRDDVLLEGSSEIALRIETRKRANFIEPLESTG